jgi:hypothetical protein
MKVTYVKSKVAYWNQTFLDLMEMADITVDDVSYDYALAINTYRNHYKVPTKVKWITWVQDHPCEVEEQAELFNEHTDDVIIGYESPYKALGFDSKRLYSIPFPVGRRLFKPKTISKRYDIVFVSNKGLYVYNHAPLQLYKVIKKLEAIYAETLKPLTDKEIHEICMNDNEFYTYYNTHVKVDLREKFMSLFIYWLVCECLYRQAMVDHCIKQGFSVHVWGVGWKKNPKYCHIASDMVSEGDLVHAYSLGKYVLHLNSLGGVHQRPIEALYCGCKVLNPMQGSDHPETFDADAHYTETKRRIQTQFHNIVNHVPCSAQLWDIMDVSKYTYKEIL